MAGKPKLRKPRASRALRREMLKVAKAEAKSQEKAIYAVTGVRTRINPKELVTRYVDPGETSTVLLDACYGTRPVVGLTIPVGEFAKELVDIEGVYGEVTKTTEEQFRESYGEVPDLPIPFLVDMFKQRVGVDPTQDDKEAIGEYYRIIESRGLPAYYWMCEVLHVLSKKTVKKRTMRYACGMIRQWLVYGFGHIPTSEEADILDFFAEVVEQEVSQTAGHIIQELMGRYGVVKVARGIADVKDYKGDKSTLAAALLQVLMGQKFEEAV